jgi:hypothetical protein
MASSSGTSFILWASIHGVVMIAKSPVTGQHAKCDESSISFRRFDVSSAKHPYRRKLSAHKEQHLRTGTSTGAVMQQLSPDKLLQLREQ